MEARDVPALFAVHLGSSLAGDTAATITGSLPVDASLPTDADGDTLVEADSIQKAVGLALTGTITVEYAGQTWTYSMGVDTVGASPAEQKPFLVTADGSIQFEDMAGAANSDWDYNDCFWAGTVRVVAVAIDNTPPGPPAPPVPPSPPAPPVPPSPPTGPTITISPITNPTEGAVGSFLLRRSSAVGSLTATYGTPTGTALEGADYSGSYFNNRTVTFLNGQSDAILSFSTIDDTLVEPTETIVVGLTGAPGYTIVGEAATVLIYDNDSPTSPPTGPPSPQVPPVPPKIEFVDSADTATVELKVARWENSFIRDAGSGINNKPKAEFIDTDPDRFKVRVTDEAANKNANVKETINVLVKTDFDTTGHELTLTETEANSGVFVSKTLLMTSTKVDDEYKVDDIEDSTKNDRTLRILNLEAIRKVTCS